VVVVVVAAHHVLVPVTTVAVVVEQMHKTDFHHIKAQVAAAEHKVVAAPDPTVKAKMAASYKADQLAHTVVVVVADTMVVVADATSNRMV
jgi:predicted house-cleaning NTP pyrophosphatase (Maf/HAM1 superfamily)